MHRARLTLVMALAASSVLTTLSATSASGSATTDWATVWSGVAAASGTTLASGTLADSAGTPSSGATVILFAEPVDMTDPAGSPMPISRTTTNALGEWATGLPSGYNIAPYVGPSSMINFQVATFEADKTGVFFFSAQRTLRAGGTYSLDTDPEATSGVAVQAAPAADTSGTQSAGTAALPDYRETCTTSHVAYYYNRKTWVGKTLSEASSASEHFSHEVGSSSSLGVGYSVSGAFGSFSASGTQAKSNSVRASFAATHGVVYRNYWGYTNYVKVKNDCVAYNVHRIWYTVNPMGWAGGYTYSAGLHTSMSRCSPVSAGTTVTKSTTKAYTNSIGVDLAIVGVSLTSQTGYSSATSIDLAMGTLGHPWCGYADYPGGAPQLMTIHNSVI